MWHLQWLLISNTTYYSKSRLDELINLIEVRLIIMTLITPRAKLIEEILDAQTLYAIPKYQREFKWREQEAQELLDDINSYKEDNQNHLFLGTFIFETPQDQKTHVVDGQQRLTSIMLLLIACREKAKKLGLTPLQHKIQEKLTFVDSTTAQSLGCKFVASESIRDLFEFMANSEWLGDFPPKINNRQTKKQVNRIKPIFQFFATQISGFDSNELSQFLRSIYNSYVFQMVVENDEEALSIFERTNARGLDLEVGDLLKNYLFSQHVQSIDDKWKEIVGNSDGTILRMLKYFYVSKQGYISKPNLYRELKSYAKNVGSETLTSELVEFSRFYYLTKDPTEARAIAYFEGLDFEYILAQEDRIKDIVASLQGLKEFGITQFCPVAYATIDAIKRIPDGTKSRSNGNALIRILQTFEKYHFVNNVICERVGNEVEQLYAKTCKSLADSKPNELVPIIQKFTKTLLEKRASWDEFQTRFVETAYNLDSLSLLYYIFDRIINANLLAGQRLAFYNPDTRILRKSHNIEHFMPSNPDPDAIKLDKETKENIDNIGNLLPLHYKTNDDLANFLPDEKIRKLRGEWKNKIQNTAFAQDFVEKYGNKAHNWNGKAIKDRAQDLAEFAFNTVWNISS